MINGFRSIIFIILVILIPVLIPGCSVDNIDVASSTTLVSLAITPSTPSMAPGTILQLEAIGKFSNNTTRKLTDVTWGSSDSGIATVNETGLVTSELTSSGTMTITATSGTITSSTILSFFPLVSIEVTPVNATIAPGTTQQLIATGTLRNEATQDLTDLATWNSLDTGVATITGNGLVVADSATTGTTTISATFNAFTGTILLTTAGVKSIAVTPENPTIIQGGKQQFTAIGTLLNNATQNLTAFATWSLSAAGIVAISNSGLAISAAPGSVIVTASFDNASGSTVVTITAPTLVSISITPANQSIALGTSQQFTALGTFSDGSVQDITSDVTWISSNAGVASASNTLGTKGLVTSLSAGTSGIFASFLGITSSQVTLTVTSQAFAIVSITVTPSTPSLRIGNSLQFTAIGVSFDGRTQVDVTATATWSSSNSAVAFVSQGFATVFGSGTTTITATSGGISGSTLLTVTAF